VISDRLHHSCKMAYVFNLLHIGDVGKKLSPLLSLISHYDLRRPAARPARLCPALGKKALIQMMVKNGTVSADGTVGRSVCS